MGRTPDDLTARARIRDAALQHFAEQGFERTTIRDIARTAGVSPGLLRHHFGSKEDLRDACDQQVVSVLREVNAQVLGASLSNNLAEAAADRSMIRPYQRYMARMLLDGSKTAAALFDEIVAAGEEWLAYLDRSRPDEPVADRRLRAALMTAMTLGIPLLHHHITRTTGLDVFSDDGDYALAQAMIDIYSQSLMTQDQAADARAGLAATHRKPSAAAGKEKER
jgi:AcrR family transcriptional regulator